MVGESTIVCLQMSTVSVKLPSVSKAQTLSQISIIVTVLGNWVILSSIKC